MDLFPERVCIPNGKVNTGADPGRILGSGLCVCVCVCVVCVCGVGVCVRVRCVRALSGALQRLTKFNTTCTCTTSA